MSLTRALTSRAVLASVLLAAAAAAAAGGCQKKRPAADPRQPAYRRIEGVDIWVDRSPPRRRYEVLTTEDPTLQLDATGQRTVRMGGDEAVLSAVARRAKAVGADAALMVTAGPAAADDRPRRRGGGAGVLNPARPPEASLRAGTAPERASAGREWPQRLARTRAPLHPSTRTHRSVTTEEQTFRAAAAGVIVLGARIGVYRRLRAKRHGGR